MQPKLIEKPAFKVVGLKKTFAPPENAVGIPALWEEFGPVIDDVPNKVGDASYGVCVPSGMPKFDYIACVEVANFDDVPAGMCGHDVAARKYAVFTHTGHISNLQDTMAYIYGTWVPKSGYDCATLPSFEYYDHRFDPMTGNGEFDIYMGIEG